jgi:prepilin-type N-terminal cleavage/methylation domain-containing protein
MLNKILLRKIKFPLSLRGAFSFCHSRESGNPSSLSLRGTKQACPCESRGSNLSGFSLIELMVAITILAMAIFGIFQAYSVGFMGMADARDRTVATNYAREEMENLKNMSFDNLDIGEAILFTIPAPTKFSGTKTIEKWNGNDDLKKVTTVVRWDDRNGIPKFEVKLETLIYNND